MEEEKLGVNMPDEKQKYDADDLIKLLERIENVQEWIKGLLKGHIQGNTK